MKREDYVGFSFNGKHSSEFNIVRTSGGSRFTENLLPTVQDKTTAVPGGDGAYLFGTHYTQRPRQISFAYDNLTERKLTEMIKWLEANQVGELILDEWPHKAWDAKVSAAPTISFIPFDIEDWEDESESVRRYKGEGTISFVAYQPYAHNPKGKKWLNDYSELMAADPKLESLLNVLGVVPNNTYDSFKANASGNMESKVNNSGNFATNFSLTLTVAAGATYIVSATKLEGTTATTTYGTLKLEVPAEFAGGRVRINSKLHLIEGLDNNGELTGQVYNNWIKAGDFFKLEQGESLVVIDNGSAATTPSITYNHYYY